MIGYNEYLGNLVVITIHDVAKADRAQGLRVYFFYEI